MNQQNIYNSSIIGVLSIASSGYDEDEQIDRYTMTIFIISLLGFAVGVIWLKDDKKNHNILGNNLVKWSLNIGGAVLLTFIVLWYWNYLNDYTKLVLISIGMLLVLYYVYKPK